MLTEQYRDIKCAFQPNQRSFNQKCHLAESDSVMLLIAPSIDTLRNFLFIYCIFPTLHMYFQLKLDVIPVVKI